MARRNLDLDDLLALRANGPNISVERDGFVTKLHLHAGGHLMRVTAYLTDDEVWQLSRDLKRSLLDKPKRK